MEVVLKGPSVCVCVCRDCISKRRTLVWQLVTMARCQEGTVRERAFGVVIWWRVLHDQVLAAVLARVGPAL